MKKSTWVPVVFALALAAAAVALFGWPGPARQFLVAQKDWIRSLGAAVAVLSAAVGCVLSLRGYLRRLEAAAEKPAAGDATPVPEAQPETAVSAPEPQAGRLHHNRLEPHDPAAVQPPREPAPSPPAAPPGVRAGGRGVAIGGAATGTVIATGDGNVIAETVNIVSTGDRDQAVAGDPAAAEDPGGAGGGPAIAAGKRGSVPGSALEVFVSYAREDESLRAELDQHLSLLVRQGWIRPWHQREIAAGDEWRGQIDERLGAADLILLLVSSSFLGSDYCFDVESRRALERHVRGEARVIPVIVRPCDWATAPFAELQPLPEDGKPVTTWDNRDEAWLDVVRGLRHAAEVVQENRGRAED